MSDIKYVIIGNKIHARTMLNYIKMTSSIEVAAFCVDGKYIEEDTFCGKKVIALENLRDTYSPEEIKLIMGIGYLKMSAVKADLFTRCKALGYQFENYIHPTAIVSEDVVMGEGNNILEGVIIESGVVMGDANLFFGGSLVGHESEVGSYNTFAGKSIVAGCAKVCNNCFIGMNAIVRDFVCINDYVLLGAGAYASKSIDEYSVLVNPPSVILEGKKSTDFL